MSRFAEWIKPWIPRLAMMALAFGSSVGIYHFSLMFYSEHVAQVIAGSFDLTYLGLAVVKVRFASDKMRKEAVNVARTACATAMLIVTLAGLFHLRPELLENKPLWGDIALSLVHGVPLSFLAYRMSNLILHPQEDTANVAPTLHSPTRTTKRKPASMRTRPQRQPEEYTPVVMASETQQAYIKDVTDKTRDIVKLWNGGMNKSQIATELGATRQAVQQHLKRASEAGLHVRSA